MKRMYFLVLCLILNCTLSAFEMRMLYQKNEVFPSSDYEKKLVDHVQNSFEKSIRLESKLTGKQFKEIPASNVWRKRFPHYHSLEEITQYPSYHLLNNLCTLAGSSHLHIGLLAGDSFIAALYENDSVLKQKIGVDWFQECPEGIFYANCNQFLPENDFEVINSECFKINKSLINQPIDIYFYDADHHLKAHKQALTYFNDVFSNVFVVMIDDWNCEWIRGPTFQAFDQLGYCILYENVILNLNRADHGQYIAVIKKSHSNVQENQEPINISEDSKFTNVKNEVFQKIRNSWCSEQKAGLIMDCLFQHHPLVCVEIGSFTGSSFLPIVSVLSLLQQGHAYAIDAWSNVEAVRGISFSDPHYLWWSTVDMQAVYHSFLNMLNAEKCESYYTVLSSSSFQAASRFDRIDFLHLDGSFCEQQALKDVELYLPKVPSGGYILLSNLFFSVNGHYPKMKALWALLEQCEIIAEVDQSQTILFKKR